MIPLAIVRSLLITACRTTNTYNAGNELATSQDSLGVTTSTFDGSGNLLTSQAPGNQSTTNTWDGESRLTRRCCPWGSLDSFAYNGDGLRVQKIDSTGTTNHVWDARNILLETNASGNIQVVYTLGPLFYGNLISQSRSGTDSFYLFDALGSTRQLMSITASVTDTYLYDSFGNTVGGGTSGTTTNPFRYIGEQGYYTDPSTGAVYIRARFYAPVIGRFISRDPIPLISDDRYPYARNSPAIYSDPSGLQAGQNRKYWDIVYQQFQNSKCANSQCLCIKLADWYQWIKAGGGTLPNPVQRESLSWGCVGLVWIFQAFPNPTSLPKSDPTEAPNTTCFGTSAGAANATCSTGKQKVRVHGPGPNWFRKRPWSGLDRFQEHNIQFYLERVRLLFRDEPRAIQNGRGLHGRT